MNVEEILRVIQDLRTQLATMGVSNSGLAAAGAFGLVLFMFSLREVLGWYLRIYQVRDELRSLRAEIQALQATLADIKSGDADVEKAEALKKSAAPEVEEPVKLTKTAAAKFRLDH